MGGGREDYSNPTGQLLDAIEDLTALIEDVGAGKDGLNVNLIQSPNRVPIEAQNSKELCACEYALDGSAPRELILDKQGYSKVSFFATHSATNSSWSVEVSQDNSNWIELDTKAGTQQYDNEDIIDHMPLCFRYVKVKYLSSNAGTVQIVIVALP